MDLSGYWMPRGVYNNWKEQFLAADAIVFMIDATDRVRLEESKIALDVSLLIPELLRLCEGEPPTMRPDWKYSLRAVAVWVNTN